MRRNVNVQAEAKTSRHTDTQTRTHLEKDIPFSVIF